MTQQEAWTSYSRRFLVPRVPWQSGTAQLDGAHAIGLCHSWGTPSLGGSNYSTRAASKPVQTFPWRDMLSLLNPSYLLLLLKATLTLSLQAVHYTSMLGQTDGLEQKVAWASLLARQKHKNSLTIVTEIIVLVLSHYTPRHNFCTRYAQSIYFSFNLRFKALYYIGRSMGLGVKRMWVLIWIYYV